MTNTIFSHLFLFLELCYHLLCFFVTLPIKVFSTGIPLPEQAQEFSGMFLSLIFYREHQRGDSHGLPAPEDGL